MSIAALFALASAAAAQAGPADGRGADVVSATASARIVAGIEVRQREGRLPEGPHVQVTRGPDGRTWIEFT